MKKIYIKPNIEVFNIGLQQMIANSITSTSVPGGTGIGTGGTFPGGSSDAKELPDWEDWEEDLDHVLWK